MKILIVCQYYYPENFVISNISETLVRLGNDVTVLTGKPNYGYGYIIPEYKKIKYEEINGVKVHRVNLSPRKKSRISIVRNYLSFWKNSKHWVRKCKTEYDIVYSMSLSPVTILSAGNLYKKKHKVKHVVHCVDLWPESVLITHAVKEKSLIYKILYKWSVFLYSQVDQILIGSPSYEQYFRDILNIKETPIKFVPQPSVIEKDIDLSIDSNNEFNILYCGNLGIVQKIELIPEIMKYVKDKSVKFHVIGMGPKSDELQDLIKENSLENKLIYHGPMPAIKTLPYYEKADITYISLAKEGYVGKTIPNKIMMSMALGKPILGVLDGDGKDIILNCKCGYVVNENPIEIANKIDELGAHQLITSSGLK